jgi:prevent-host-death family protein
MTKRISAREARTHFAEITDRVKYTGEPVIVEKQGQPFVAVVSLEDLDVLEKRRREKVTADFTRQAAEASDQVDTSEPREDEIVEAVKRTREALYRERYGTG